jgi:hypothetical protein
MPGDFFCGTSGLVLQKTAGKRLSRDKKFVFATLIKPITWLFGFKMVFLRYEEYKHVGQHPYNLYWRHYRDD